jgi:hypothetical protein
LKELAAAALAVPEPRNYNVDPAVDLRGKRIASGIRHRQSVYLCAGTAQRAHHYPVIVGLCPKIWPLRGAMTPLSAALPTWRCLPAALGGSFDAGRRVDNQTTPCAKDLRRL